MILTGTGLGATESESGTRLQPLFTRYAETAGKFTFDATVKYFYDKQLEEAIHFDGWTFDLDATLPFRHNMQFRLILPIYTTGTAYEFRLDQDIRIEGFGGTFDFPSVVFEHQFTGEPDFGHNLAYFAGVGGKAGPWAELETTHGDTYNHQGRVVLLGLKTDRHLRDQRFRVAGNMGLRFYWRSDDLNPGSGGDTFYLFDVNGSILYNPGRRIVYPALEAIFRGDFYSYNAVQLVPQAIFPLGSRFQLKAGIPFALTPDGERFAALLRLTAQF